MAFLDNSGDIILDAVLTDTGRRRLARRDGTFKVAKFALGDDEINYRLFNACHASGSAYFDLEVLQTPVLEAFTDPESLMHHRLMSLSRNDILYLPIIELFENSDFGSVKINYQVVAPRMYQGRIESVVSRITGFADMIQLTHLKLQQVMSRMVPDGVYLDVDGLAEVDLGNGTNYNPQEALNMFFQTGSVIGRSFTYEGDGNPGKVPIQQINNGVNSGKIQSLIYV